MIQKSSENANNPQHPARFPSKFHTHPPPKAPSQVPQQYPTLLYNSLQTAPPLLLSTSPTAPFRIIQSENGGEVGKGSGYHQGSITQETLSTPPDNNPLLNLN